MHNGKISNCIGIGVMRTDLNPTRKIGSHMAGSTILIDRRTLPETHLT